MTSTNIIREGDSIIITAPITQKGFLPVDSLRKQFPGVTVSVIYLHQIGIEVVSHYRPGRGSQ